MAEKFQSKVIRRVRETITQRLRKTSFYQVLYPSYWYARFHLGPNNSPHTVAPEAIHYFSAVPNPGAGIGHQIANWIAGYWYARYFGISFAHIPFSNPHWETFLGFGDNELSVMELTHQRNYKKVKLPLFDEHKPEEVALIRKIIASYCRKPVVFIAEQDQFYADQYGVMNDLKQKFYNTKARLDNRLVYDANCFNIAIHIRRGDITVGQETQNLNLLMRWQDTNYFENVLANVVANLKTSKPIVIYLFSQGEEKNFSSFSKFGIIHFCLNMNAQDSFLHMVYADLLITSKSSFSYKPALLNKGIKVCPGDFWHGYPDTKDWILADENGNFGVSQLNIVL